MEVAGNMPRLSLRAVYEGGEEKARAVFQQLRWPDGRPICPACLGEDHYFFGTRKQWKCKHCHHQFSVTSGTIFASRKMRFSDLLAGIVIFVNGAKGVSSLQLSRDLDVQYKTAFVLAHKLREAIENATREMRLSGIVEIDGCTIGGFRLAENFVNGKFGKRTYRKKFANRRIVVVMRERGGSNRTATVVVRKEIEAFDEIIRRVEPGTVLMADGAHAWDGLAALFEMIRINHIYAFAANDACTNWAESYNAMLRRAHRGVYHKMSASLLNAYATEIAWRQDVRAADTTEQACWLLSHALSSGISARWAGYWQRKALTSTTCADAIELREAA